MLAIAPFAYAETTTLVSPSPNSSPTAASSSSATPSRPPTASASPTESTPEPTATSPTPRSTDEPAVRPAAAAPSSITATATVTPSLSIQPNYGLQKVRVGVQLADGAYVPQGTTTAGSTLTLVRTSSSGNPAPQTSECTTGAPAAGSTVSYCLDDVTLAPGETLQITQTTAGEGAVLNPEPIVVPPCANPNGPAAARQAAPRSCENKDAIIIDDVLPPTATDDEATVDNTGSVNVAVLANDDTQGAPILALKVTDPPTHGRVAVTAKRPNYLIRYTPDPGFVGTDSFGYTYQTANGSVTGTVTVTVTGEAAPPTPNYGFQKVRVGVQIADGSYVPRDTTTAGSRLTIVRTGLDGSVEPVVAECTTGAPDPDSPDPNDTVTYCPLSVVAGPGETVTITQTSVGAGLVVNSEPFVVQPCENPIANRQVLAINAPPPTCVDKDAIITDRGLPPAASNDRGSVANRQHADVDVLANDDTRGAPVLSLAVTKAPNHGTAEIAGPRFAGTVRYTPAAGYIGTDTFDYTYRTANGSATATVTVGVGAAASPPAAPPVSTTAGPAGSAVPGDGGLASTGGPAGAGLGLGLGLLLGGAGTALLARRRRGPGRHV